MTKKKTDKRLVDMPSAGPSRSARKNFYNYLNRKRSIPKYKRSRFELDPDLILYKFTDASIINGFFPERAKNWTPVIRRREKNLRSIITLESFSILDNPVETISKLNLISEAESNSIDASINFSDPKCFDLGPYMILSEIVRKGAPIFNGGAMQQSIAKVIDSVGLRRDFSMAPLQLPDGHSDVWAFRQRQRRPEGSSQSLTRHLDPQRSERVAGDLIDEIDRWLGVVSRAELSSPGRKLVSKIVGEILDNAERYSDDFRGDGDWKIAGFMARRKSEPNPVFRCHLAFLSVGTSIAQSFARADDDVKRQLEDYLNAVGAHNDPLKRELHSIIFALQDGVTADPEAFRDNRGGTGLLEVLELFCGLSGVGQGAADAQLGILSGRGYLRFFPPYVRGIKQWPDPKRRLWLNDSNMPGEPPSPDHAMIMPHSLNGTLVTMAFNLDRQYLEKAT